MKNSSFPAGWDEQRVRRVIDHYERQSEMKLWPRTKRHTRMVPVR